MPVMPQIAQKSVTESVGIQGWQHLDSILLASLVAEFPLLLIGAHGTGKTLLVERLSRALGLSFRHYNASLINYDDLVGIPMPDEAGESLHFISARSAIWQAEFVFFDEISRCRPDLQNKLFPIIHEKRVMGIDLMPLQHRWSAMNPPSAETLGEGQNSDFYVGAEQLDMALLDRFPFVVRVPKWRDLSRDDRKELVRYRQNEHEPIDLGALVESARTLIAPLELQFDGWLGDYVVYVLDLLDKAGLPQSPRRAWMLARCVVAVHAARVVLFGEGADIETSAELALVYGIPQAGTEVPPSETALVMIHKQAWEIVNHLDDERWLMVFEESDLVRRVVIADEVGFEDEVLSGLITQALGAHADELRQVSLAVAMFLSFSPRKVLNPASWEPLAKLASRVLVPRYTDYTLNTSFGSNESGMWNEIKEWAIARRKDNDFFAQLSVNFILGCFPDLLKGKAWRDALALFVNDLKLFNVKEMTHEQQ